MSLINVVPTSPILNIDVSAVSKVVLLPAASTCVGTTYNIRDWKAACSLINKIFLSTVGLDRVDGVSLSTTQLQMTSSLEIVKIMSLGNTAWSIVGRNKTVASTLGVIIRPYIPLPAPLLVFGSLVFDGTLGSTSAAPKLTWSNSGGTVESYTLNLLSGSTSALGTSLSITPPAAGDTSYTYAGATVNDTFYSFLLVATNVTSSSTLSQPTPIRNRAAPVITLTSFTFGGTVGSTSAAPTLVWSSTGGAVESYALVVYGDANSTPTTVLSSTPPASGDLSYAYPGSTVASYYYKMVLTATNVTSPDSVITTSAILNISPPILSQTSFAFAGTKGSTSAAPTLVWSNSGGAVASYTLFLFYGATTPPITKLGLTAPAIGDTSYTYTGTTTNNYYYKFTLNGTNAGGGNTLTTSIILNVAAPSLTSGVLTFDGTLGSTSAAPKLTWSNSGGTVESYTLNLLSGSTSGLGTSLSITPPAAGDTSYTYAGATVNDTYYSFLLVATNVTSSSTLSQPTAIQNIAPVHQFTGITFTLGGTIDTNTTTVNKITGNLTLPGGDAYMYGNMTITGTSASIQYTLAFTGVATPTTYINFFSEPNQSGSITGGFITSGNSITVPLNYASYAIGVSFTGADGTSIQHSLTLTLI